MKTIKLNKGLKMPTKLWISDATYEKAKESFALSLQKLGLDYLDLWNPGESRLNGKSKEAITTNAQLDKLMLSIISL